MPAASRLLLTAQTMQPGFVTAILPELSFGNVLNFACRESFSTVEVMF